MSTQYKRAVTTVEWVAEALKALKAEDVHQASFNAAAWLHSIDAASAQLADLHIDVMRKKASERDPQKKTYGPAMSAKVLDLAQRVDSLREELLAFAAQAQPLAAAQAAEQAAGHGAVESVPGEPTQAAAKQDADADTSMPEGLSVQDAGSKTRTDLQGAPSSQAVCGVGMQPSARSARPEGLPMQKPCLPKRPGPTHKYASAFHAASQKAAPVEQGASSSTTRECDTEPSETPNAATQQYQRDVYRGKSGQLVDKPAPVTTKRSHSAGLPVSVRTQRLPLPISITGQRSLQPLQVNPEQQQQQPPPQQQRPPMTASEYQRSIYRGDSGRQAAGSAGQAAQQQPGSVPVSHAGWLQGPQEPTAEKAGPADRAPDHKNEQESVGADKAAPEQSVTAAEAASSTAVTTNEEGMTKATTSQMVVPETAPASSQVQPAHAPQQQGLGSASGEPAVQAQFLHMPPLPPPAVHHVQMGKAELDDTLKVAMEKLVLLDFSASWCGPCRMMKPVLERLAQRYWGVLDILAIDCEATVANRQLAQEYAISGFPTFVLLHRGRRVDQFSGARPEPAMAQYLEWHMSQTGARDALLQQRLFAALSLLRQHAPTDTFQKASSTLLTIVGNLVDKPEEAKFRRIRKASAAFQQSLGRLPGGCEALLAVGFTAYTEPNGEQVLTMGHVPKDLGTVRSLLAAALGTAAAPSTAAPGPPSTSAGQVAPTALPPVHGQPAHQTVVNQLLTGLPRPPQCSQSGNRLGAHEVAALSESLARAFAARRGQSQSTMGQLDAVGGAGSSRVPGGASELEEEDPELSDVLKRSLEEH